MRAANSEPSIHEPRPAGSAAEGPLPLRGQRVAVTGATGFLGARLVAQLVDAGARVIAVAADRGWRQPARELIDSGAVTLVPAGRWWEPGQASTLLDHIGPVEHFVHLAYVPPGVAPAGAAGDMSGHEVAVNVRGSCDLLAAAGEHTGHVCFASSSKVYGRPGVRPVPEETATVPSGEYGRGKLAVEQFLQRRVQAGAPLAATVLRLSTLYGPAETVPRAIPNFIRSALDGRPPTINGDGREQGDYLHVNDAAEAFLRACGDPPAGYRCLNVGSGVGISTAALAGRVSSLVRRARGGPVPDPIHIDGTAGPDLVLDVRRARDQLGVGLDTDLDVGVLEEIGWLADRVGVVPTR